MLRTLSIAICLLLLPAYGLLLAPEAEANGIIVANDAGAPVIIRRRPPHPPHPHPRRIPPVRLKGHRVTASVTDRVAEVTVEQVFHNDSPGQLEGTYLFPLPDGASVSQFAMTMGGKMVEGEVIEASKARRIYQSIVQRRRDPGLLEYMGRGLFRARVFPILPHQDLTIRLTFQQVLPQDGSTIELRYPLATDRLNATPVESVLVDIKIDSTVDLKAIYSPSHKVEVTRDGERKARVSYERTGRRQDKDFLLYISRSPDAVGFSLQTHKTPAADGTFMAVLAPRTEIDEAQRVPKDVVYVLDTSGSMAGPKIEQAHKALAYGVRMLHADDRFNVIAFASGMRPYADELKPATKEMKEDAVKWIDGLKAAGGTNIEGALTEALAMKSTDRLFMVVFLTDGLPTVGEREVEPLVKLVKQANTSNARIYTFGVGFDLDVRMLDRLAEVTNGTRDYVMPEEDIEIVTGRFFRKVDQPVLSDVVIELGSGVYDVYPQRFPDLFAGGQVVVFGRYKQAGNRLIRLKGRLGGKEVVYDYEGTFRQGEGAGYLPRLWAHRKVAFLLDEIRLHGHSQELVDEIVKLATRYAIVTPYTAGLVVEEGEMADMLPRLRTATRGRVPFGGGGGARPADSSGLHPPRPAAAPGAAEPDSEDARQDRAATSKALRRMKEGGDAGDDKAKDEDGLDAIRERIETVAEKTFMLRGDGRWVDTAWDGKKPTKKVEAYSDAYFELMTKSDKIAKYLALGEQVVFVLEDVVYEIVPAKAER